MKEMDRWPELNCVYKPRPFAAVLSINQASSSQPTLFLFFSLSCLYLSFASSLLTGYESGEQPIPWADETSKVGLPH